MSTDPAPPEVPESPLFVTVLTGAGRAAIAVVELAGHAAAGLVDRHFHAVSRRSSQAWPSHQFRFGSWTLPGGRSEQLIVLRTAQDRFEIQCHGGSAVVQSICHELEQAGATRRDPEAWSPAEEESSFVHDARRALRLARTERTAAILLDQLGGALDREHQRIEQLIAAGRSDEARQAIGELLQWSDLGLHLTRPFRIILAGKPNAGKSSLANALLGYSRSIVAAEPGTTRDVVTAETVIAGWPIELADTAGLREARDEIEREGVGRASAAVESADLVVIVADVTESWCGQLQDLTDRLGPQGLIAHNKCDLAAAEDRPEGCEVSALQHSGLDHLWQRILRRCVPVEPAPGTAIPFTPEQIAQLSALKIEK